MSTQPVSPPDPNALLMGGGGRSAKFENPGDKVEGTIIDLTTQQQTTLEGEPKFFDSGDPMWEIVVTLQTDERDPDDTDDDGVRKVYISGSMKYASKAKATRDAVAEAGAKALESGGHYGLAYTGDGEPTKRGYTAPKLFVATYRAPVATADPTSVFGGPAEPDASKPAGF